ncbi:VanW family protein [Agathobaculum sp.]|uniref:VanW family protein n=1 Tax=Agathobaculum sp. TaxID=2048138 RepID=UPI001F8C0B88|nr:VanW family protein [Candidatus Agathobaculum intestinigallinarum]
MKKTAKNTAPKAEKKKFRVPLAAKIAGGLVLLLFVALCGFTYLYPNVFPGVTVGTIPVGGMSRSAAVDKIEKESGALYEGQNVSVTIYETTYDIPVEDVLQSVDSEQSAANAFAVGRTGNPFVRMWNVIKAAAGQNEAQIAATVDEDGLTQALEDIASKALTEPVEPTWEIGTDTMTIYAGKPGVNFDSAAVEQVLDEKIRLMDFEPYEVSVELSETPQIDIDKIAEQVIGDPVSATVSKEDGKTIIPEKVGVQFDVEEARTIIGDGSAESYEIPVTTTAAKVTAEKLEEVLFRDTLASCSTSLNEGNVPRTNNVRLASAAINGTILNPGEEFSYNNVVGERTTERGYQSAGAYSGNEIIDEVGGGVCQPSSTLYMAVLRADLEVTQRVNHSFTVAYTPLGEDATVSWGGPDFCFKNDTDYPIKILAEQSNGQLTMTIVGTKTSDKTVTTRTEVIETYTPQRIEKKDNSMMVGQSRVEVSGIPGYSTRTYKIITENGQTTEELANTSNYIKRDEVVYVGTIQPKAETPSSEPDTSSETQQEEPAGQAEDADS